MAERKKSKQVESTTTLSETDPLSFDDLDGGTTQFSSESLDGDDLLVEAVPQEVAEPVVERSGYSIPIPTGPLSWITKDIEDVSGEEFVAWVEDVYPPLKGSKLKIEQFDPSNHAHVQMKKYIIHSISNSFQEMFSWKRGTNPLDVGQ